MGQKNAIFISLAVTALVTLGLVMLASTSFWNKDVDGYSLVKKQAMFIALGLIGAVVVSNMDYRKLRALWIPALIISTILLVMCYVPGIGHKVNGATRWIRIPGLPQFQPSELAKIFVIIALAAWYSHYQTEGRKFLKGFVSPSILLGVPVVLIFFEKDMGTAMALGTAGATVMFAAGTRIPYMISGFLIAVGGAALVILQNPERMGRINALFALESEEYRQGDGYQQLHGINAFIKGGVEGTGLGNGLGKHGSLPMAHTDFIFPAIGEELGLWATLGSVFCFVVILVFGLAIAMHAKDVFGKLLAVGLTCIIVVPAMVNIGVCTAVLPNTGLPLPFISYGGTNILFTLLAVGMLLSIHRQSASNIRSEVPMITQKKQCLRI
ncbi:MAG: FtsW/RodA/SpoVE family cell cycle protein [Akkermansiaceae bacterium]